MARTRTRPRRTRGSDAAGRAFPIRVRDTVWYRTPIVGEGDSRPVRRDALGNLLLYEEFGETTAFGWEIDHVRPVSRGGTDALDNLQALHWRANRDKGEAWPWAEPQEALLGQRCPWGEARAGAGAEDEPRSARRSRTPPRP